MAEAIKKLEDQIIYTVCPSRIIIVSGKVVYETEVFTSEGNFLMSYGTLASGPAVYSIKFSPTC